MNGTGFVGTQPVRGGPILSVATAPRPIRGALRSTDVSPPIVIRFQFNPIQLADRMIVNYASLNAPGGAAPVRQWSHGGGRTISFTVRLDASVAPPRGQPNPISLDRDNSLTPELNKYRALVHPRTGSWQQAGGSFLSLYTDADRFANPPRCQFGYGAPDLATSRVIDCVVSELTINELAFNDRLAPLRADVQVTLAELAPAPAGSSPAPLGGP